MRAYDLDQTVITKLPAVLVLGLGKSIGIEKEPVAADSKPIEFPDFTKGKCTDKSGLDKFSLSMYYR